MSSIRDVICKNCNAREAFCHFECEYFHAEQKRLLRYNRQLYNNKWHKWESRNPKKAEVVYILAVIVLIAIAFEIMHLITTHKH